ncbi:hypothetical protein [Waltera sp.]|uniref:hypothetical protein n=1 Tax=Waltera sp. TaxID=2815806 RepID=UPI003AF075B8
MTLYGDSRHPPKARQGFWRMQAWLVTRTPGSGMPFALAILFQKDRKYIEKCRKM